MKVLFITRKWSPAVGGMETYCDELSQELGKHVDLKLKALPGQPDGSPPSFPAVILFGIRTAWQLVTEAGGYDIVHGGDMAVWPLVLIAKIRSRQAVAVLSAHGTDVTFGDRLGVLSAAYKLYARIGARLLSGVRVVANSTATGERAAALGYGQVRVVPLASRAPATVSDVEPKPYILFVGRHFERRKGLRWFVDKVLPLLPPEIRLYVASPLRGPRDLRKLDGSRVRMLGPVRGRALRTLMAEAMCVVVPNIPSRKGHFEGFGLVTVEAAASGGVVFASKIDGFTDSVIDGETGFLLPPGDETTWAKAIEMIINCPPEQRREFVSKARAKVLEAFSWERVARETLAVYRDPPAASLPAPAAEEAPAEDR